MLLMNLKAKPPWMCHHNICTYTHTYSQTNLIDLLRDTPILAGIYFSASILLICRINIAACMDIEHDM